MFRSAMLSTSLRPILGSESLRDFNLVNGVPYGYRSNTRIQHQKYNDSSLFSMAYLSIFIYLLHCSQRQMRTRSGTLRQSMLSTSYAFDSLGPSISLRPILSALIDILHQNLKTSKSFGGNLMASLKLEIVNWEKYNPRKDLKSMPWFRLESGIATDPKLFSLSVEGKWLWVSLLSIAARELKSTLEVETGYLSLMTGIKENVLNRELKKLEEKQLVHKSDRDTNESDRDTNENVPNRTEQNEQNRTKTIDQTAKPLDRVSFLDLDFIYQKHYPRKVGKTKGLERLKNQIKTQQDLDKFQRAVINYREHCKSEGLETKFIKHFSTWVGEWKDWIDSGPEQSENFSPNKQQSIYEILEGEL